MNKMQQTLDDSEDEAISIHDVENVDEEPLSSFMVMNKRKSGGWRIPSGTFFRASHRGD
jgi:hypothetical protein